MSGPRTEPALDRLRRDVERIDRTLISLVAERLATARAIAGVKHALGLPTLDPAQEAAVIRRAAALARDAGLPPEEVRALFWTLIAMARGAERDP